MWMAVMKPYITEKLKKWQRSEKKYTRTDTSTKCVSVSEFRLPGWIRPFTPVGYSHTDWWPHFAPASHLGGEWAHTPVLSLWVTWNTSIPLVISPSTVVFPSDWTWELIHGLVKQAQFCVSFIALWSQNRSLMPAQATTVAGTLLAITRLLLQLERCSNPPLIQLVFWFRLKKKNFCRSGDIPGRRHKWGCFSVFMAYFTRP